MLTKNRVLIFDGLNVFIRHYIAHPAMSDNGEQIGGIVGFYYNLVNLIEQCKPESVIIVWEGGGSKRKRDLFKNYKKGIKPRKMNRYYSNEELPDSLNNRNYQLEILIEILSHLPLCQIYVEDAEADDAIGYICQYKLSKKSKIIISGDHDYYQLINDNCIVYSPNSKSFVNKDKVIEKYGVHPNNFCLAKSVVGDKSDNIPGVPGAGFKTLTKEFGSLLLKEDFQNNTFQLFVDNDVKHQDNPKKKIYKSIKENEKLIERNIKLVRLDIDNLAHIQIKKIDECIENFKPAWNNIQANKILNINNIKNINFLKHGMYFRNLRQGNFK
jgi:5'-3' exonuclease